MPKGVFQRPPVAGRVDRIANSLSTTVLAALPPALEKACSNFETEAGGREALVTHLAHARLSAEQELLVGAIADPRNDRHSLARICSLYHIKFSDLLSLFRDAGFVRAQLAAMRRIWTKVPDVAEDVMNRSVPHLLRCSRCAGSGQIRRKQFNGKNEDGSPAFAEWVEDCDVCGGEGEVEVQPRHDTQITALQLSGLLAPHGGPGVNISLTQQQAIVPGATGRDFLTASDQVLYPTVAVPPAGAPVEGAEPGDEAEGGEESAPPDDEDVFS